MRSASASNWTFLPLKLNQFFRSDLITIIALFLQQQQQKRISAVKFSSRKKNQRGSDRDEELDPLQEQSSLKGNGNGNGMIRYRSTNTLLELESQTVQQCSSSADQEDHQMNTQQQQQQQRNNKQQAIYYYYNELLYRYRGILVVVLVISLLVLLMPRSNPLLQTPSPNSYAVIFDAGSSGSRVHVYCFDHNLNLVPIGNDLELFVQKKPGLSAYASNPKEAAESLKSLLDEAQNIVPLHQRATTPVRVGATAGLRQLKGDASDRILQEVTNFLKQNSAFKSNSASVTVLDGTQEGAYQWVTINYLLGNLGKDYSHTVGVVDLGGGSVQMAYAISERDAAKAPMISNGEDAYVKELFLMGVKYYLYVHSYLHYGLLAARAEILKAVEGSGNPCILKGYHDTYKYAGGEYEASATPSGSSVSECRSAAFKALKVNESTCTHMKCTFGGVWNGGGGDGQKNIFVASFFFDRAAEAGFVNPNQPVVKVKPANFEEAAKRACETKLEDAKSIYPHVEEDNLPYLCMDLVYQFTLLVDGFGLNPWQEITLVKKVRYGTALVEAAWPLGSAIEVASSS